MKGFFKRLISSIKQKVSGKEKKDTVESSKKTEVVPSSKPTQTPQHKLAPQKISTTTIPEERPIKKEETLHFHDYDTQFPDSSEHRSNDIIIGFDFGTSTTKVVIRDPFASRSFAIPFLGQNNLNSNSYLLPTRLSINDDVFLI